MIECMSSTDQAASTSTKSAERYVCRRSLNSAVMRERQKKQKRGGKLRESDKEGMENQGRRRKERLTQSCSSMWLVHGHVNVRINSPNVEGSWYRLAGSPRQLPLTKENPFTVVVVF